MRFEYKSDKRSSQSKRFIAYAVIALFISFFQLVGLDFVEFDGITPDLLLVLVVWISLREGRFIGMLSGFMVGFLFDFISLDTPGINALAKVIVAFLAGSLYREGKENLIIGSFRFLIYIFASAIINNLIYFTLRIKLVDFNFQTFFLKYAIAFSFYSTIFAIFPMFYANYLKRKNMF